MAVNEIKDGDVILARHVTAQEWEKGGLNFYSEDNEFIQVGTWGYDSGKELLAHTHNNVERTVNITQETLYIRRGRIKARIYNLKLELVAEWEAGEGDIMILMQGGHGYDILEDGTQVLEVKNGSYVSAQADRVRF
ncbi:MAG: hypothetical protein P8N25_00035 [Alphaproteobacteria bacterium]|nr:hypothetical protein [Alphaproteobacteria bacterium]